MATSHAGPVFACRDKRKAHVGRCWAHSHDGFGHRVRARKIVRECMHPPATWHRPFPLVGAAPRGISAATVAPREAVVWAAVAAAAARAGWLARSTSAWYHWLVRTHHRP